MGNQFAQTVANCKNGVFENRDELITSGLQRNSDFFTRMNLDVEVCKKEHFNKIDSYCTYCRKYICGPCMIDQHMQHNTRICDLHALTTNSLVKFQNLLRQIQILIGNHNYFLLDRYLGKNEARKRSIKNARRFHKRDQIQSEQADKRNRNPKRQNDKADLRISLHKKAFKKRQ